MRSQPQPQTSFPQQGAQAQPQPQQVPYPYPQQAPTTQAAYPQPQTSYPQQGAQPQAATGEIYQGMLENSNTNVVSEMVNLINNYRIYEAGSKAVTTQDTLLDKSVNEVGRV